MGFFIFQLSRCDLFYIKHWGSLCLLHTIHQTPSLPGVCFGGLSKEGRMRPATVHLFASGGGRNVGVFPTRLLSSKPSESLTDTWKS